jgi:hypothetical protein
MANPYIENKEKNHYVRVFFGDLKESELVWHRDKEDRLVKSLKNNGWMLQLDNGLPQPITEDYIFIPKESYHRLIKGDGDLKIKIIKL